MREARSLLSLLALAQAVHADILLPYNPTRILLHLNATYAYVFGPSAQSPAKAQLSALDVTKSFTSGKPELLPVTTALPFLDDGDGLPYTSMIDASGNITVISGNCTAGSRDAQVWQFQPNEGEVTSAKGTWTQYDTEYSESGNDKDDAGSGYLSNGITFSTGIDGDPDESTIYVFGGMCPYDNSTASTWISAADYSNSMLTLSPDGSSYDISKVNDRSLPISQAGSSVTALPATYGLNASGAAVTQQQDFVLLGGNTQTAFINMSQVALFSLPQQSWSFLDVAQPSDGRTDLTVKRSTQEVTPRSGHTAVLSEDGSNIIIFGGWVGDVGTPATPQLAVLELGEEYGGTGDWKWTVPKQTGDGLVTGAGIYGHGAIMLPGGIMMVLGGYQIPASTTSSSKFARRAAQTANTQTLLYNTTSNSWVNSYDPPQDLTTPESSGSGPLGTKSKKVGLATGLGIGAALMVTMAGFYVWYGRRLKQTRDDRERALLAYSSDGSMTGHMDQPFLPGRPDSGEASDAAMVAYWSNHEMREQPAYPRSQPMQHATGAFVNIPSPTRGLRKGSVSRNYAYQPAPKFEDKRVSMAAGNIHPIAEVDNEDGHKYLTNEQTQGVLAHAEMRLREVERVLNSGDPFLDPPRPLASHPPPALGVETLRRVPTGASQMPSPSKRPVSRQEDAPNWTAEEDEGDHVLEEQDAGFTWVNGSDRTSSSLSEHSRHSAISDNTVTRTMSTKTGQLLAAAAAAHRMSAASPQPSPTRERSNTVSTTDSTNKHSYFTSKSRARSSPNGSAPPTPAAEDDGSFKSAKSVLFLPTESEALMHARHPISLDDPYQRAFAAQQKGPGNARPHSALLSSSSGGGGMAGVSPIPPRRRPGLVGSLRRALRALPIGDRSMSLTNPAPGEYRDSYYDPDGMRTSSSSPTKQRPLSSSGVPQSKRPRRAVSDGSALLRSVRGQKDWTATSPLWPPYRDDPTGGDWGEPEPAPRSPADAEQEWDVEGAAGERDFQVLFSIPKSRLRVVNDDMDRASLRSTTSDAVSRSGSASGMAAPLKMRKESAGGRGLASTVEEAEGEKEKGV